MAEIKDQAGISLPRQGDFPIHGRKTVVDWSFVRLWGMRSCGVTGHGVNRNAAAVKRWKVDNNG